MMADRSKSILLIFFAGLLVVALLEGIAFVVFKVRPSGNPLAFPHGEARLHLFVAQSKGHFYSTKPNFTQRFRNDEFDTTIKTNNRGYREDFDFDGRRPDIVSVGDSFTFGHGVQAGERYTDKVRHSFSDRLVTTLSPANGASPASYYFYLKEHPEVIPRLLMIGLFPWNDLGSDMAAVRLRENDAGEITGMTMAGLSVNPEGYLVSSDMAEWREPQWRKLASKLNLGRLGLVVWSRVSRVYNRGFNPRAQVLGDGQDRIISGLERGQLDKTALAALDYVQRIAEFVAARGGRTLVLYIPASYMVGEYPYFCETYMDYKETTCSALRNSDKERKVLTRWFAELPSIVLVDPSERFRQLEREGKRLYFEKDGHWTPAGHSAAAVLLVDRIKADRLLE